jgi:hypothetical protein
MYVAVGGILASIPNIVSELKNSKEETQLYKLEYGKNALHEHYQTDIQQMRLETTSLQKQIDSLKNASD